MQWARPETCMGQHGMPRTLLARPGWWHMLLRTSSVPPRMRSRPHVLRRRTATARPQGDSSANGSVISSQRRFASSSLTTSGCGTTSAGQWSTAEGVGWTAPVITPESKRGLSPLGNAVGLGVMGLVGQVRRWRALRLKQVDSFWGARSSDARDARTRTLERLSPLIGEWSLEASMAPPGAVRARSVVEWGPGRRFLLQRTEIDHPDGGAAGRDFPTHNNACCRTQRGL